MKKIFVTGGDGLLGSNVVRKLLAMGHDVTVMVQPGSKAKTLEGLNIKQVEADLLDKDKVLEASKGAEMIIHIAAITKIVAGTEANFQRLETGRAGIGWQHEAPRPGTLTGGDDINADALSPRP